MCRRNGDSAKRTSSMEDVKSRAATIIPSPCASATLCSHVAQFLQRFKRIDMQTRRHNGRKEEFNAGSYRSIHIRVPGNILVSLELPY